MTPPPPPPDLDDLAQETVALRRLALALVRDEPEADDLLQETFLAAADGGGRPRGGLGAWLSGVLRNRWRMRRRGEARRSVREAAAARPEAVAATVDAAARIEVQRRVLAALEALDEPFRRTVVQRYLDDRPPREIAAREGVPVATVKSRLSRALAMLRTRLDGLHEGDRRAWALLLVPGTGPVVAPGAAVPLAFAGGFVVKRIAVTLVSLVILGGAAWVAWPPAVGREGASAGAGEAGPPALPTPPHLAGTPAATGAVASAAGPDVAEAPSRIDLVHVGRVVDDRRLPVPDAVVRLVDRGEVLLSTRADDQGRWRLAGSVPVGGDPEGLGPGGDAAGARECVLEARDERGRVGRRRATVLAWRGGQQEVAWDPIVLEEGHALPVRVEADGRPVPGADVLVGNAAPAEPQPTWWWTERHRTDGEGRVRLDGLVAGFVAIVATAPDRSPTVVTAPIPTAPGGDPLVVSLPPRHEVLVRVVEAGTETPVAGARVFSSGSLPPPGRGPWVHVPADGFPVTGEDGTARIAVFDPPTRTWLRATAPSRPSPLNPDAAEVLTDTTEVVLAVPRENALVFPLEPGEGDLPADGTEVRVVDADALLPNPGFRTPSAGRIEGGRLVIPHAMPQSEHAEQALMAVLPDERLGLAIVPQGATTGEPVRFVRPRSLRVRVLDEEGAPVPDVRVGVGASNRALPGMPTARAAGVVARNLQPGLQPLDPDGETLLHPLWPETVTVRLWGATVLTQVEERVVDLERGDAEVVFELPPRRTLEVHVLVDGDARLPPTWKLHLADAAVSMRQVEEDAEQGVLRVPVRVPFELDGVPVSLDAFAYGRARGEAKAEGDGRLARVTLALDSRVLLRAHVVRPADGRCVLACERWVEEYGHWSVLGRPVDAAAVVTPTVDFGPLAPGRYRVRDTLTESVSEEVRLATAAGAADVHLDLSRAGVVHGRVEVPPGVGFDRVGFRVEQGPPSGAPPFVQLVGPESMERAPAGVRRVAADGTFTLRVPGDREVVVRAWHPWLREGGPVRVTTPSDDLVLRLERGPTTTLVLPADLPERVLSQAAWAWHLLRDGAGPAPAYSGVCEVTGREARFGGYAPGTYSLWLDVPTRAPLLRRVTLGPGDERIDVPELPLGSTVVVTVRDEGARPRLGFRVRAEHLGTPAYVRSNVVVGAKSELRFPNLGAGRFRVLVRDLSPGAAAGEILLDAEIEADGETDVPLVLDLGAR